LKSKQNIQNLIAELSQSLTEDYNTVLKSFDFSLIDFTAFESWSQHKYTRNCLYRGADYELILLCWEPGQVTAIHGHDGEDCWVYLLEGEMEEVFYTLDNDGYLREERSTHFKSNQLSFMNDRIGFHKLKNTNLGRSISLHVYAKPIENCVSFDEKSQQFIQRKLSYDTFKLLPIKT
jgi:predicted metal-dependent enzyme (double-stranded beta helix superfamily)